MKRFLVLLLINIIGGFLLSVNAVEILPATGLPKLQKPVAPPPNVALNSSSKPVETQRQQITSTQKPQTIAEPKPPMNLPSSNPAAQNIDVKDIVAIYNANNIDEAKAMIMQIPEKNRDAQTILLLANIFQDNNQESEAIKQLQNAITKDETYYKAYFNLANIYFKQNKIKSAIENYKLAIRHKKDFPYNYYNLGCCYLQDGDFGAAKSNFMQAIKLKNNDPQFYYNLALAYKKMNNEKQAQKILDIYNSFEG